MERAREPRTLIEAVGYFANPDVAFDFAAKWRWPTGKPVCPRCGCLDNYFISRRRIWKCAACKRQFSIKVGTVFEDSPIGFEKWLPAMWLIVNSKNGVSSHELGRALGVTQKTAWFMTHRIRLAMQSGTFEKLNGTVEVDETFVGGLAKNMHKSERAKKIHGTGGTDKTMVGGALRRTTDDNKSRVHAEVQPDRKAKTLSAFMRSHVEKGVVVYTDAHRGYNDLSGEKYVHSMIDHAVAYVDGQIHTNGIESFWNLFKRGFKGTYTHMNPEHLNRYVAERVFTFNEREVTDIERMRTAVKGVAGRRVTYAELTGNTRA